MGKACNPQGPVEEEDGEVWDQAKEAEKKTRMEPQRKLLGAVCQVPSGKGWVELSHSDASSEYTRCTERGMGLRSPLGGLSGEEKQGGQPDCR